MIKRYRVSIGSSIILHAVLIAIFFRMKIPVMENREKTHFSIVFTSVSNVDTIINSSSHNILSESRDIITNREFTRDEALGTVGRLKIPSLNNDKINKLLMDNSFKKAKTGTSERIITDVKKLNPDKKILMLKPDVNTVLNEVGKISGSENSISEANKEKNPDNGIKWNKESRHILKSKPIAFPDVLKAEGQDAAVKAKIYVNADGNVRKVEIIKGSGYIKVDSAVAAALRQYLFNPAENNEEDIGIIEIHFKLKRED